MVQSTFKRLALGLSLLFVSMFAYADYTWNFPKPVTPVAKDTLHVHNFFMVIVMVIFVVVLLIMIYSIFMHRKSRNYQASSFTGPSTKSQLIWTLVPFAILLYIDFILMGIPAYNSIVMMEDTKQNATMVVKITGSQWKWQYEYMSGEAKGIKFVSNLTTPIAQIEKNSTVPKNVDYLLEVDNKLVLPVGEKVRVLLTATDVIHNWWVPAFGVSRDAIPGFLHETWLNIEEQGVYKGQCKELCGKGHGYMPAVVEAVSKEEYKVWVAAKQEEMKKAESGADREWAKDELMSNGKVVYEKSCAVCHQVTGAGMPPMFPPLTGSKIATGPIFGADGKYLPDSHLDRVFNGKGAMPPWKGSLNDIDIASVITYERNALGNATGDLLQPAQVKAAR